MRKPARKAARRKTARRTARKRPAKRTTARRPAPSRASATRRKTVKPARRAKAAPKKQPRPAARVMPPAPPPPAAKAAPRPRRPVAIPAERINRERRQLSDDERLDPKNTLADDRMISAARTGHRELQQMLHQHTEAGPEITAGDVDASWEDAYAVGDEAPGGDNPTPDQDRVDDIGRALGVEYADDEELKGAEKLQERDRHRWELDPASSDDWPHDKKKES